MILYFVLAITHQFATVKTTAANATSHHATFNDFFIHLAGTNVD